MRKCIEKGECILITVISMAILILLCLKVGEWKYWETTGKMVSVIIPISPIVVRLRYKLDPLLYFLVNMVAFTLCFYYFRPLYIPDREHEVGLLTFLCFPPTIALIEWIFSASEHCKRKLKNLSALLLGVFLILSLYHIFLAYNIDFGFSTRKFCFYQAVFTPEEAIILSFVYGMICIFACFQGLKIERIKSLDYLLTRFMTSLTLVSAGVAIFLFLVQAENIEISRFLISLVFFVVAVSFLYVIFGYFSKGNECNNPIPLVFLISVGLSFVIGFTLSVLILEAGEATEASRIDHWPFICIWTIFFSKICAVVSKNSSEISNSILRWYYCIFKDEEEQIIL